ncbi:hypothetical protein E1B28_013801 [Marasmius oreades]|uniref:Gag-like protein n=1 Tax=Marasmius oreades TaxID=181124 RepID=A0A9P7RR44_9AGAR|nr:uncharacterized protein E1B28_013801 [Marasmius oreades]KAG7087863.1 hypothetical protein E1B28_013801 [Marasmius oreades]
MANEMKTILSHFTTQQRDTSNKLDEILKQNLDLTKRIRDVENKLVEANRKNDALRQSVSELMNAGITTQEVPRSNPKTSQERRREATTNETSQTNKTPTTNHQPNKKKNTTPEKATAAHHPSRLVVRFKPDGIKEYNKISPEELTRNINGAMRNANIMRAGQGIPTKDPPLVVAARYTERNSSLVISTREDQTAEQLMDFFDDFKGALAIDIGKYKLEAHADKKWFKIQVDNVATLDYYGEVLEPDSIQKELSTNNPSVQELEKTGHLSMPPRWLIPAEELKRQSRKRSSFIFATDVEEAAVKIVKGGYLALFGQYCGVRPFQDRPPVQQCNDCWRYGHFTKTCKYTRTCRLCSSEDHDENQHQAICSNCRAEATAEDLDDVDMAGECVHHTKCGNCYRAGNTEDLGHAANSRECPIRKNLYGTVRSAKQREDGDQEGEPVPSHEQKTPQTQEKE